MPEPKQKPATATAANTTTKPTTPKPPRKPRTVPPEIQAARENLKAVAAAVKMKAKAAKIVSGMNVAQLNALSQAIDARALEIGANRPA